jgi:hypothetical protein
VFVAGIPGTGVRVGVYVHRFAESAVAVGMKTWLFLVAVGVAKTGVPFRVNRGRFVCVGVPDMSGMEVFVLRIGVRVGRMGIFVEKEES